MHEFEDNESGKDDSLSADDTVVDGERSPFDILNDAGILTTPELSSFDESGRALQPILLVDFLGESEESENYESANSHEEQIAASIHKRRMGNEIPVPRLVSPVTGFLFAYSTKTFGSEYKHAERSFGGSSGRDASSMG